MLDRDKVILALEICSEVGDNAYCPQRCPYMQPGFICSGSNGLMKDALALLKEQEPVMPIKEPLAGSNYAIWQCGECKAWLRISDRFCGRCGKKVKRDADGA